MSPREFLHLGSRAAVDQAFSRLTTSGQLLRAARGVYVVPVEGKFGKRPPAPEKVIESIARQSGEKVVPHGSHAANHLRLTQQVPVRSIYLTSGRSRKMRLGKAEVELQHAPSWMLGLGLGNEPAGGAVRALVTMGPAHVTEALQTLHKSLSSTDWESLKAARARVPTWLGRAISMEEARV